MSLEYATKDDGDRVLLFIICDKCEDKVKPNPNLSEIGWMRSGTINRATGTVELQWEYCPQCASELGIYSPSSYD